MNINLFENEQLTKTESVSSILTDEAINQKYIDGEISTPGQIISREMI